MEYINVAVRIKPSNTLSATKLISTEPPVSLLFYRFYFVNFYYII